MGLTPTLTDRVTPPVCGIRNRPMLRDQEESRGHGGWGEGRGGRVRGHRAAAGTVLEERGAA